MTKDLEARIADLERQVGAEVNARNRLVQIATTLNSTFRLDDLLQLIIDSATELLDAQTGSLLRVDEETGDLVIEIAAGSTEADVVKSRIPAGQGVAGWVAERREAVVLDDPSSDPRFYKDIDTVTGFETEQLLAVPLVVKNRCIGVLEVLNRLPGGSFTAADLELATALAGLAAIALDNAAMYTKLADALVTARMSYRL